MSFTLKNSRENFQDRPKESIEFNYKKMIVSAEPPKYWVKKRQFSGRNNALRPVQASLTLALFCVFHRQFIYAKESCVAKYLKRYLRILS